MTEETKRKFEQLKKSYESCGVMKMTLQEGKAGDFILTVHDFQDKTTAKKHFKSEKTFLEYLNPHVSLNETVQKYAEKLH